MSIASTETSSSEQHPAHSLSFLEDAEHGIRVPVTQIALDDSPNGEANPPLTVYRTAGPGSDPVVGLPPYRAAWIAERGDTEEYEGRERNLLDDGRSALRRGAASAEWRGAKPVPRRATAGRRVT